MQKAGRLLPRFHGPYISISQVVTIGVLITAAPDEELAEQRGAVLKEMYVL